jgi:hypothetical protein
MPGVGVAPFGIGVAVLTTAVVFDAGDDMTFEFIFAFIGLSTGMFELLSAFVELLLVR